MRIADQGILLASGEIRTQIPGAIQLAGIGKLRAALVLQPAYQARRDVILEGQ